MQGIKSGTQFNCSNASFMAIVFAQLTFLIGIIFYCFPKNSDSNTSSAKGALVSLDGRALEIDKAAIYHSYASGTNAPPADAKQANGINGTGVVIDAWRANTYANRRACQSLWLFDRAHEEFCKALRHTIILAVRETDAMHERIAYAPAPAETRVSLGDQINFVREITGADDRTVVLPAFSMVSRKKSAL